MTYAPINRPIRVAQGLTQAVFEDVDINLFDLYTVVVGSAAPGFIEGRTFRRCRLQGPVVLLVAGGVSFDSTNFGDSQGDIRNLLLRPLGVRAPGTLPIRDCVFEGCEFYNVAFTGPEAFLDQLTTSMSSGGSLA
jgi:hypothetical protein